MFFFSTLNSFGIMPSAPLVVQTPLNPGVSTETSLPVQPGT